MPAKGYSWLTFFIICIRLTSHPVPQKVIGSIDAGDCGATEEHQRPTGANRQHTCSVAQEERSDGRVGNEDACAVWSVGDGCDRRSKINTTASGAVRRRTGLQYTSGGKNGSGCIVWDGSLLRRPAGSSRWNRWPEWVRLRGVAHALFGPGGTRDDAAVTRGIVMVWARGPHVPLSNRDTELSFV